MSKSEKVIPPICRKKKSVRVKRDKSAAYEKAMAQYEAHRGSKQKNKLTQEYINQLKLERDMLQEQCNAYAKELHPNYKYEKSIGANPEKYFWNDTAPDNRQDEWKKERHEYGFDERQTWNLNATLIAFLYPRLKMYQEYNCGYPANLTSEKWKSIIDEMIDGFEYYIKNWANDESSLEEDMKAHEKAQNSFNLLAKYWDDLWW